MAGADVDGPASGPKLPMPKKPCASATEKTSGEAGLGRGNVFRFSQIGKKT